MLAGLHTLPTVVEGKTQFKTLDAQLAPGIVDRNLVDLTWYLNGALLQHELL